MKIYTEQDIKVAIAKSYEHTSFNERYFWSKIKSTTDKATNKEKAKAHELGFDSGLTLGLTCSIQHAKTMLKTWKDLREVTKNDI